MKSVFLYALFHTFNLAKNKNVDTTPGHPALAFYLSGIRIFPPKKGSKV